MMREEKVTKVIDGATFKTNRRQRPVRLKDVNAPGPNTKRGDAAKKALEKIILRKTVSIQTVSRNRSENMSVANVKLDGRSVNKLFKDKKK